MVLFLKHRFFKLLILKNFNLQKRYKNSHIFLSHTCMGKELLYTLQPDSPVNILPHFLSLYLSIQQYIIHLSICLPPPISLSSFLPFFLHTHTRTRTHTILGEPFKRSCIPRYFSVCYFLRARTFIYITLVQLPSSRNLTLMPSAIQISLIVPIMSFIAVFLPPWFRIQLRIMHYI